MAYQLANINYVAGHSHTITQHDGDYEDDRYFYVNDRLGSVRQVIDMYGSVKRNYTYSPFGQLLESGTAEGAPSNPFMFTGQWFDDEISQYFSRARMYDPALMRFTARDPVRGKFREPLTLHMYLYCLNDPINNADPTGEFHLGGVVTSATINASISGYFTYRSGGSGYAVFESALVGALAGGVGNAFFSTAGIFAKFAAANPALAGGLANLTGSGIRMGHKYLRGGTITEFDAASMLGGFLIGAGTGKLLSHDVTLKLQSKDWLRSFGLPWYKGSADRLDFQQEATIIWDIVIQGMFGHLEEKYDK